MRDQIRLMRPLNYVYLAFCLLANSFSMAYAAEVNSNFMSDMGSTETSEQKRPRWNEVNNKLRSQLAKEYRSPNYDEKIFFAKYVELVRPEAILGFLEAEEATCHPQAHELGRAIFRKYKDINEALKICGNGCTNACMHGAIGEAFSDDSNPIEGDSGAPLQTHGDAHHQHHATASTDKLVEKMEPFCHEGEMERRHKRGNCAHAMGHALMLKTDHDIGASITGCSQFNEPGMDYYCATGVYMQYMDNVTSNGSRQADTERWGSNYPCNTFTAYPAACYRYIVNEVKEEQGLGLEHLVVLCGQLPDETRAGCFHGLGATYAPIIKTYPGLLKVVCSAGNNNEQALCIEGAVEKLADFNEQWAITACKMLDRENKDICLAAAHGKMYRLDKPTMELYRAGIQIKHEHH